MIITYYIAKIIFLVFDPVISSPRVNPAKVANQSHLVSKFSYKSTYGSLIIVMALTVDHNKLWKILKEMEIPEYLTCLLRNLYTG